SLKGEYMEECKGPRAAIAEIMQRAKDSDLDMPAFKTLLKEHRDMRVHEKRLADLDLVQQSRYAEMIAALGDFGAMPLGDAALKKTKPKAKDEARSGV